MSTIVYELYDADGNYVMSFDELSYDVACYAAENCGGHLERVLLDATKEDLQ